MDFTTKCNRELGDVRGGQKRSERSGARIADEVKIYGWYGLPLLASR